MDENAQQLMPIEWPRKVARHIPVETSQIFTVWSNEPERTNRLSEGIEQHQMLLTCPSKVYKQSPLSKSKICNDFLSFKKQTRNWSLGERRCN